MIDAPASHQKWLDRSMTNALETKPKRNKIDEPDRYPVAHNGLVAGSSPAGPTSKPITFRIFILPAVGSRHQNALLRRPLPYFAARKLSLHTFSGYGLSACIVDLATLSQEKANGCFAPTAVIRQSHF
jgi:hypothetical protein